MARLHKLQAVELSLEQKIAEHLGDFELIALLRLLKSEGFKIDDIWFSSHNSIASQNRVIESVSLRDQCTFIQLNLGLLASTGFLPGHIRQFMEKPEVNEQGLELFFQFFDHVLITSYLGQLYPEINKMFFDYWPKTKKCYTELQNMRSECSLHWLFECAFPEFHILITRVVRNSHGGCRSPVLGRVVLGENDGISADELAPLKVHLVQRLECSKNMQEWPSQVRALLHDWVFPWLSNLSISLDIYLCLYRNDMNLKLHDHSSLGYDLLHRQGDVFINREKFPSLQCFSVHRGPVCNATPNDPSPCAEDNNITSSFENDCNINIRPFAQHQGFSFQWEDSCRIQI